MKTMAIYEVTYRQNNQTITQRCSFQWLLDLENNEGVVIISIK